MAIIIREVSGRKFSDIIVRLHEKCFPADKPLVPSTEYWWLAFDGKIPIAFAAMAPSPWWLNTGYLCRYGVLPEYRGKGLQKRLIRAHIAKAIKLGWTALVSDTRQNPASANSFISCGFKMYNPERTWSFKDASYWLKYIKGIKK